MGASMNNGIDAITKFSMNYLSEVVIKESRKFYR